MNKDDKNSLPFFLRDGFAAFLSSVICIICGMLVGYIIMFCINPGGAGKAILAMFKNFLYYKKPEKVLYYFGSTLVKSVPLIMCSLSVLFSKKAGLFNIGVAGQYTIGAGVAIFFALRFNLPWYICALVAMAAAALWGMLTGVAKAYRNANEVITGIMLNWIALYLVNMFLLPVKDPLAQHTLYIEDNAANALLPNMGLDRIFGGNHFVGIGLFIAPIVAVIIWSILKKTKLGYELKATGYNKDAAFYSGMHERGNIILTTVISGALAGLGAALLYLSDIDQWSTSMASVPSMGFDGIAAAFLGGLHPIGAIFSSYFVKHITLGGMYIDKNIYNTRTADMMVSFIIYFCAFAQLFRHIAANAYLKRKAKKDKEKED